LLSIIKACKLTQCSIALGAGKDKYKSWNEVQRL
jgi:hypothetical protein